MLQNVSSSCSTCGIRRVTLVTNAVMNTVRSCCKLSFTFTGKKGTRLAAFHTHEILLTYRRLNCVFYLSRTTKGRPCGSRCISHKCEAKSCFHTIHFYKEHVCICDRENQRGNQELAIQGNCKQWAHKTKDKDNQNKKHNTKLNR